MEKNWSALLRIAIGWLFFYAGITKVLNPAWSPAGYLGAPKMFPEFYAFLASPNILPITTFLSQWGLTVIGAALILGIFMRPAGVMGALMMLLFYFPVLDFPYPNDHSYIVDEHIIYALVLLLLNALSAGSSWSLGKWASRSFLRKIPVIGRWA
jgi:thiosulfate dehydrogenase [quinone] large subunit